MNYLRSVLLFSLIAIFFGCGSDGQHGDVFLRFRSVLAPIDFTINSPDIPEDFEYDQYYKISPGIYYFTYIDYAGVSHPQIGEFDYLEIEASIGESGSLFKAGDDGSDLFVDLIVV